MHTSHFPSKKSVLIGKELQGSWKLTEMSLSGSVRAGWLERKQLAIISDQRN